MATLLRLYFNTFSGTTQRNNFHRKCCIEKKEKMGSIARESCSVINAVQSDDAQEGFSSVCLAIKPDSENSTAHE